MDQIGNYTIEVFKCSGSNIALQSDPCAGETRIVQDRWIAFDRDRGALPVIEPLTQGENRYPKLGTMPFLKT